MTFLFKVQPIELISMLLGRYLLIHKINKICRHKLESTTTKKKQKLSYEIESCSPRSFIWNTHLQFITPIKKFSNQYNMEILVVLFLVCLKFDRFSLILLHELYFSFILGSCTLPSPHFNFFCDSECHNSSS